ncbi:hypothetical protein AMS68_004128 [Peltaster fructicola]|uniref:Ecp2 effector protein domain-containing protein n=1 Tax=Peltaster fructicola TaxID=286661 RepID=A0A6H0XVC8_9PEZI|nr:hypothetical protein AMS68_004128 [Peltaster fructicola]
MRLQAAWLAMIIHLASVTIALPAPDSSASGVAPSPINVPCSTSGTSSTCGLALDTVATSVVVMTSGSLTVSQTFHGTSLSGYNSLTAATTLTTTDSAGETVVAVVLAAAAAGGAAGLAWLAVPKPIPGVPGVPSVGPPNVPPNITPSPTTPAMTTMTTSTRSSTVSTSSTLPPLSVVPHSEIGATPEELKHIPPARMNSDLVVCGFPGDMASVNKDYAKTKLKEFCNIHKDQLANVTGIGTMEIWNSAPGNLLNITVSQTQSCATAQDKDDSTIDLDDCNIILPETLDQCPDPAGNMGGGTVLDGCLQWSLKPVLSEGILTCDGVHPRSADKLDGTGANRKEAIDNVKDFCKGVSGKTVNQGGTGVWNDYRPRLGNSYMTFGVDYSKDPDCTGEGDSYKLDEATCTRLLSKTVDGCDTNFREPTGKFGGRILDGCGQLRMSTTVSEVFTCGFNFYNNPASSVPADVLKDAIDDYCNQDLYMYPDYSPKSFVQFPPKDLARWEYTKGNVKIIMSTYASSEVQDQKFPGNKCADPAKFGIKGDDCKRKMMVAANQCQSGNSAGYLNDNSAYGCIMWQWAAVNV